jgi:hypothetical protein
MPPRYLLAACSLPARCLLAACLACCGLLAACSACLGSRQCQQEPPPSQPTLLPPVHPPQLPCSLRLCGARHCLHWRRPPAGGGLQGGSPGRVPNCLCRTGWLRRLLRAGALLRPEGHRWLAARGGAWRSVGGHLPQALPHGGHLALTPRPRQVCLLVCSPTGSSWVARFQSALRILPVAHARILMLSSHPLPSTCAPASSSPAAPRGACCSRRQPRWPFPPATWAAS